MLVGNDPVVENTTVEPTPTYVVTSVAHVIGVGPDVANVTVDVATGLDTNTGSKPVDKALSIPRSENALYVADVVGVSAAPPAVALTENDDPDSPVALT